MQRAEDTRGLIVLIRSPNTLYIYILYIYIYILYIYIYILYIYILYIYILYTYCTTPVYPTIRWNGTKLSMARSVQLL